MKQRSKSIVEQVEEDDGDEEEFAKLNRKYSKTTSTNKKNDEEEEDDENESRAKKAGKLSYLSSILSDANSGAQSLTQKLFERNRERQLKQKQYRKEHDLKLAFSEFYLSLILLQNYQTLNFTGFRKILKKHDKDKNTKKKLQTGKEYVYFGEFGLAELKELLVGACVVSLQEVLVLDRSILFVIVEKFF